MSLFDLLQALGDRLGILELSQPQSPQVASKIQTRTVTLAELAVEIRSAELRTLAEVPAELSVSLEKVFETAGIHAGPHGWTVDKLKQLLMTEPFATSDRATVQKLILDRLSADAASAEDVVKDAMARDRALDSFEAYARKKLEERKTAADRRLAEMECKIEELQAEAKQLRERMKVEETRWQEWRKLKRAEERELARAVGYLIDRPVITTDEE